MTNTTTAIQTEERKIGAITEEQKDLLKRTYCKGATDDELTLFLTVAQHKGLDPFSGQIHAVKRWDASQKREVMSYQVAIDGFRLIAQRTGERNGEDPPQWYGTDGKWYDVWNNSKPPIACRVKVYRKGHEKPYVGIAYFDMYAQRKREGGLTQMWTKGAAHMLAKCGEALALRKAFPAEMSNIYTSEELGSIGPRVDDDISRLSAMIDAAKNREELEELVPEIRKLSSGSKGAIKPAYREKQNELVDAELDQSVPEEETPE